MHFLFRIATDGARFVATGHLGLFAVPIKIELGLCITYLLLHYTDRIRDDRALDREEANETNVEARVRVRVRKGDGVRERERERECVKDIQKIVT